MSFFYELQFFFNKSTVEPSGSGKCSLCNSIYHRMAYCYLRIYNKYDLFTIYSGYLFI